MKYKLTRKISTETLPKQNVFSRFRGFISAHVPRRVQIATVCFAALFALPAAAAVRPGMRVTLDGKTVAYVANADTLEQAVDQLEKSVTTLSGSSYTLPGQVALSPSLTTSDQISSEKEAVAALADAAEQIDMLAVLTVNREPVGACATVAEVQSLLDDMLSRYKSSSKDKAAFTEEIKVSYTAAPSSQRLTRAALADKLAADAPLHVKVTATEVYTEPISYETLWVENAQMNQDTTKVLSPGVNGSAKISAEVTTVDGVETDRTVLRTNILARPQNAVVAFGTRNIGIGTGELIVPISNYRFTSAFKMRDGRWHKGVDLAATAGTPVLAADNGKVITAEWSDSYGYHIVLDHQNGLKTLYAHNSLLLANVGDTVEKGTEIALSGNTGNSTGPHLHFEVHQNDTAVNPQQYITISTETP